MKLYLDIETIGTSNPEAIAEIAASITPPGNISKAETIAAWEADKKPALIEDAIRRTSFDGALGQVICFGFAFDNDVARSIANDDEKALLGEICDLPCDISPVIVGHNVGWDIRFLWQRFVINGIPPPAWLRTALKAKPWDLADTMTMWNPDRDKRISLDKLCRLLGVPSSKGEMDGSKVWDAYRAGKMAEIAKYCMADVEAMRACYLRMTA